MDHDEQRDHAEEAANRRMVEEEYEAEAKASVADQHERLWATHQARDHAEREARDKRLAEAAFDGVEISFDVRIRVGAAAWKSSYGCGDDELINDVKAYFSGDHLTMAILETFPSDEVCATVDVLPYGRVIRRPATPDPVQGLIPPDAIYG